jgi:hypothetical protein
VKGSAGSVAFALDEVLRASPAYRWTLKHTLRLREAARAVPDAPDAVGGSDDGQALDAREDDPQQERRAST